MTEAVHSFDLAALTPRQRYKVLSSTVVPRPIALVVTKGRNGVDNAAPYSFFNVFSEDPALVVLGLQVNAAGDRKDTARNIIETGEFVVNLVDERLAEAMNICAVDFPPDESEISAAGLTLAPSRTIAPGRIVESPVALECTVAKALRFGERRDIVIGEVSTVHVRQDVMDPATLALDIERYKPLGRLFGGLYSRQADRFDMPRMTLEEWEARRADPTGDPTGKPG